MTVGSLPTMASTPARGPVVEGRAAPVHNRRLVPSRAASRWGSSVEGNVALVAALGSPQ